MDEPTRTTTPPQQREPSTPGTRFSHLPPPIRREDLRTSQDVVPHPEYVGEADRERDWLLRTTGLFI